MKKGSGNLGAVMIQFENKKFKIYVLFHSEPNSVHKPKNTLIMEK